MKFFATVRSGICVAVLAGPVPSVAQEHDHHTFTQPDDRSACEQEAERHRAMGHPVPQGRCEPAIPKTAKPALPGDGVTMDRDRLNPDRMDRSGTAEPTAGHSMVNHAAMGHGDMPMPLANPAPPATVGAGPARAADAIWGADAMRASRTALARENGGMTLFWFQAERAEYRFRDGADSYLWDVQGYYGGDLDKFWFKSEGEGIFGEKIEAVELQALYSRAIGPFFDLQAGVRHDLAPRDRTYAAVGIQGLAPYLFEIDAAAFVSDRGDLTARIEAELDQKISQRLILQPRAEVNLAAQDVRELGIGAGLDTIEAGLRLRYEFAREFAPYVGIEREWKVGKSADYARLAGDRAEHTNVVAGVRFWF